MIITTLPTKIETTQDVTNFARGLNSTVDLSEDFIWCFLTEWSVCKCPYDNKVTRANRIALVNNMFNL